MIDEELRRLLEAMRQENAIAHADTRRHVDVAVERLEKRFDTLAESVASVDEKLDRTAAETQAMIKFSQDVPWTRTECFRPAFELQGESQDDHE